MSASTSAKQLSEGAPQAAMSWLLHSGIQDASARLTHQGGVHGWYDFDTQSYPFIYSEITGYAIALYSAFFELTGDRAFLARAEDAARWLTQQALHHSGGVRTRLYRSPAHERESVYSFTNETLFTFDTGIALEGLVAVHRHSRNDAHLQAALRMAAFLAGSQQPDGAFAFAVDGRSGEPCAATSSNLQWSRETGPHHARCILGLSLIHI